MAKKSKEVIKPEQQKAASAVLPERHMPYSLLNFRTQAIILAIIGFVFYCNTFFHESAFDDRMAITDNEYVQAGLAGVPDILTKDAYQSYLEGKNSSNQLAGGRYRPLSLITFAVEQQFIGITIDGADNGRDARVAGEMHIRHLINVLLYILSAIVLLYFLRQVVFPSSPIPALLAAILFTIHPIHTEVVANVKSRDEILSVLFICLTFIKGFSYFDTKKKSDLWASMGCFFLALLSKEYAVTLLILLPLSFYLFRNLSWTESFKVLLPYLAPFGLYLLLRFAAVSGMEEGASANVLNNPYLYANGMEKIATKIAVLFRYIQLLLFPSPLIADYSYRQIPYTNFGDLTVLASLATHICLGAAMGFFIVRRHLLGFALAVYLMHLALVSNLLFDIGATMGERLIYHSSIGFAIALAWMLYSGYSKIKGQRTANITLGAVMSVLIIFSGIKTIARNADWKNDSTLFLTDVKKAPNSALANNNAAAACMSAAKNAPDGPVRKEWFEKAIGYFDQTLSIYPEHLLSRLNRGLCYFNMGNPYKALPDWDTVRKYSPKQQNLEKYLTISGKYFFGQGMKYESAGQPDSAVIAFGKCAEATPAAPEPWYRLGNAYLAVGRKDDAKRALEKALQLMPNYGDALRLYGQLK